MEGGVGKGGVGDLGVVTVGLRVVGVRVNIPCGGQSNDSGITLESEQEFQCQYFCAIITRK